MNHLVRYDLSYSPGAFLIYTNIRKDIMYAPDNERLQHVLKRASQSVFEVSNGHWMIVNKNQHSQSDPRDTTLGLWVIVPASSDRYAQMLAAVAHFEAILGKLLGAPIDTGHRLIEADNPK